VELIEPPSESERRRLRGTLGAVDGEVLIGCVGNYREVKRHELLIDAFAALARDRRDLRLVLVGEGPMRSHIEQQVERLGLVDRIRIHGAESDVRPLYGAFDLVVQASRSEGMPNVLLEAAAAGRPIVATAAGGSTEIVLDGETGLLVPVEDLDALTAAMRRATEDADLRSRLAAAARQHVAEVFGMDRFVRDWIDLYEGLAVSKHLR
jgi:glycosyltransferase involved in cell wall biosynthesis